MEELPREVPRDGGVFRPKFRRHFPVSIPVLRDPKEPPALPDFVENQMRTAFDILVLEGVPDDAAIPRLFSVLERRALRTLAAGFPRLTFLVAAEDRVGKVLRAKLAESAGACHFGFAEGDESPTRQLH